MIGLYLAFILLCPVIAGTPRVQDPGRGAAVPSLTPAIEWLRQYARSSHRTQIHVLVTGSLYLIGDVLKMLGRAPK